MFEFWWDGVNIEKTTVKAGHHLRLHQTDRLYHRNRGQEFGPCEWEESHRQEPVLTP